MGVTDIIPFLGPSIYLLIVFIVLLVAFIITLTIIQRRLKNKVILKDTMEKIEGTLYNELNNLRQSKSSTEEILDTLDYLARNFLIQNFKIKKDADYAEMIKFFKKKNMEKLSIFCHQMIEALYSGEKINRTQINYLINKLEETAKEREIEKRREMIIKKYTEPSDEYEIFIKLVTIDDPHVASAYKNLQELFKEAYRTTEKTKNKENLEKLYKFRETMREKINEYVKDQSKIKEFAKEISKGATFLSSITQKIEEEKPV